MASRHPDHATDFGHPPSTAPPALGGLRHSTAYDGIDPFSAVQRRLTGFQQSYGHPHSGSAATTFATSVPTVDAASGRATGYTGPPPRVLVPPTSALSTSSMLGHPAPVNLPTHSQPTGYITSNAAYYDNPLGVRPQMPSNSVPVPSGVSFGHPAMAMAPAMDPMAFFGATSSSSGLRLVSPETLDAASRQSNWARRVSASRPPKGKGKVKVRGAANPTPSLGDIPVLSAVMLACPIIVEFYPWVNTPGERRRDIFIFTERLAEFRTHQAAFGTFWIFPNIDFSCPIASLLDLILKKMTSAPFHYRFEDLEEITGRDGASIWERLPFFILVPTNKGTPRTTTGAIHLDVLPEFRPLTLGGLTEAKKIKDAANHSIWEERAGEGRAFVLRIAPKVPFTARSATAFTTSVKSTVHQHTCIKDRMEFCLTTNNVQEGLPTYRKAQGTDYHFDAGELSSNEESIVRALRARRGEASYTTLESDRDQDSDGVQAASQPASLPNGRRPEPFPLRVEPPPDSDETDLPDLARPTTTMSLSPNLLSQAQTNEARGAGSSGIQLAINVASNKPASSVSRTSTASRQAPINSTPTEPSDSSLMDIDIDVPSPDEGPVDNAPSVVGPVDNAPSVVGPVDNAPLVVGPIDNAPSFVSNRTEANDHQRLFEATPPSLDQLFSRLPRSNDLNDFTTLIPAAAANPQFPNQSLDPLLPAQEAGIDIQAMSVEDLAAQLEAAIRQAIESKDFTKVLARRSFFAM